MQKQRLIGCSYHLATRGLLEDLRKISSENNKQTLYQSHYICELTLA